MTGAHVRMRLKRHLFPARCTRIIHAESVRGVAARPASAAPFAILSAHACAVIRAVERGQSRYRHTKSRTTKLRPARWAGGPKARERRAERMRRMQGASGRLRRSGRGQVARRARGRKKAPRDAADSVLRARGVAEIQRPRRRPKLRPAPPDFSCVLAGASCVSSGLATGISAGSSCSSACSSAKRDARRGWRI
jgi:hypothetical protein